MAGYTAGGNFEILKLRTFNAELQYQIENQTFMTVGCVQLWSSNIANFIGVPGILNGARYDRSEAKSINWMHDFSSAVRVALEFDPFNTHYEFDWGLAHDN